MGIFFKKRLDRDFISQKDADASMLKQPGSGVLKSLAGWMAEKTGSYNYRQLVIGFTLFVFVACGYNFYQLMDSFLSMDRVRFSIYPIHRPMFFRQTGDIESGSTPQLSGGKDENTDRLKLYIDSLRTSSSKRRER